MDENIHFKIVHLIKDIIDLYFNEVININKVHQIITNLCVFNVKQDGLEIIEYADGVDRKKIEEATEAKILN